MGFCGHMNPYKC